MLGPSSSGAEGTTAGNICLAPEFLFLESGTHTRIFQWHKVAPA
jgi:hypothetical protein